MELILSAVKNDKEYKNLVYELTGLRREKHRLPMFAQGLCEGSFETFAASVCRDLQEKALIVVGDDKTAAKLQNSMLSFFERVYVYPKKDFIFMNMENVNNPFECERLKILDKISSGDFDVVITTLDALLEYTIPKEKISEFSIALKYGENIKDLNGFLNSLLAAGYKRADTVEAVGRFSVRGGIIDIFSPSEAYPVRIELFGDEIDSMGVFDPVSQRRVKNVLEFRVIPAAEIIIDGEAREKCVSILETLVKNKNTEQNIKDRLYFEADSLKSGGDISSKDRFISHIYENKQCMLDYFDNNNTVLFINESSKVVERQKVSEQIINETVIDLVEKGYIDGKNAYYSANLEDFNIFRAKFKTVICDMFLSGIEINLSGLFSFTTRQSPHISEGFALLKDDLENFSSSGYKIIVFLNSDAGIKSLADTLTDFDMKYIIVDVNKYKDINNLPGGYVIIIKTPKIAHADHADGDGAGLCNIIGFELPKQKFVLITDSLSDKRGEILKKRGYSSVGAGSGGKKNQSSRQKIMSYTDLSAGDYVVHSNYGIGIFLGIKRMEVYGGVQKDFIQIKYDGTDLVNVPCNQLDLVSKYIGARSEDSTVKLSKIGGASWQKAKSRAKSAAKDIADELIKLYAARQVKQGYAFLPDTEWQKDFESLFEYSETEDQLVCAEQIKTDMQQSVPMDRLLCGDVGFGKTEVALRAVFKCVSESKQAAFLVPTTILAWQHYQTILSRFREFPVKIDMMSRFKSKKEQAETLKKLKSGDVDIVIGTHRIIQNDVKFKDLGLLVVDEEQRFGVAHKEKIKQVAENIDVLTLTATPIPRTLNMALSGIRDMSVIEEAPHDRIPVQTYIFEYDENIIAEALKNEIRRGGQVFYLHNRVETIEQTAAKIKEMCKSVQSINSTGDNSSDSSDISDNYNNYNEIKVGIAHGQMDEESLSRVWQSMLSGETDILVCTTIIESGIDVPDANTLIVEDADRLGLAQLHQIRGRVGRSNRRAYAYLTYPKNKVLTEIASKRLKAIREYTEFGSGFKIAMRDLEIRGAGNLLGSQQHGAMEGVGYDLYVKILEKAVSDRKKKLLKNQNFQEYITDLNNSDNSDSSENLNNLNNLNSSENNTTQKNRVKNINKNNIVNAVYANAADIYAIDGVSKNSNVISNAANPEELEPTECLVDIAVDAFIPNRYIESEILRIEIYKRIAAIENNSDADDLKDELLDRFGNIPRATENLIDIALIRNSACGEYIDEIKNTDRKAIVIYSDMLAKPYGQKTLEKWTIAAAKMNGRLLLSMGQKPHVTYFLKSGESVIDSLKSIMNVLEETRIDILPTPY